MAGSSYSTNEEKRPHFYVSPYDVDKPLDVIVIHNRSKNANLFAATELKKVWPDLKIIQVVESLEDGLAQSDQVILINNWTDMVHFKERFNFLAQQDKELRNSFKNKRVGFYCVWSAAAEDELWAQAAKDQGFIWIGASPEKMMGLDKISFKQLCKVHGVPTAEFIEVPVPYESKSSDELTLRTMAKEFITNYQASPLAGKAVFAKHANGGGGRGTHKPSQIDEESLCASFRKIVNETGGDPKGVYVEEALDLEGAQLFQLELEGDAGTLAYGSRLVYFNNLYQKVLEVAFTEEELNKYIPAHVHASCRKHAELLFKASGYDNRGTIEILIIKDKNNNWTWKFSEFNKRIQVEHATYVGLATDQQGRALNVAAEQVMRSLGYAAPKANQYRHKGPTVVGHVRLLSCNFIPQGLDIPLDLVIKKAIYPSWADVQYVEGPVNTRNDAQLGRALIPANSWSEFCDKLLAFAQQFQFVGPRTDQSNYLDLFRRLAVDSRFRAGLLSCNQTMTVMNNPPQPKGKIQQAADALAHTVTPLVTHGYAASKTEAIKNQPYPTEDQIKEFKIIMEQLRHEKRPETAFSHWVEHKNYGNYIQDFKADLRKHGGGTVNVMRDVFQSRYNQHSFAVQKALAALAEVWGARSGIMFGHETGGAQLQAGIMHGYHFMDVLLGGCPSNLPSHSLTRSKWLNGLKPKSLEEQRFVIAAIAKEIQDKYDFHDQNATFLPWVPYNFHAGNFYEESDQTVRIFLENNLPVIPSFAWSPRYEEHHFEEWVLSQIKVFKEMNKPFNLIRIKNAGQGPDWSAEAIVSKVETIRRLFKEQGLEEPVTYIHNHEFDGKAAHIGADALKRCQANGYPYLVVDSAPPGTTHNDNMVIANALIMSDEERAALRRFNEGAQLIMNLAQRFNNDSVARKLDTYKSLFAGGTTSSDISDAIKQGIPISEIEPLKAMAMELTGLGTAVTPYSEWMKQIGYAIYTEDKIQPKTVEAVKDFVNKGGKLLISELILQGLQAWKTLLPRKDFVAQLLINYGLPPKPLMSDEAKTEPFDVEKRLQNLQALLPNSAVTLADLALFVGFDDIGLAFLKARDQWKLGDAPQDLTLLMDSPEFVLAERRKVGDSFELFGEKVSVSAIACREGKAFVEYLYKGQSFTCEGIDPQASSLVELKPKRMVKDRETEMGAPMSAKLLSFFCKPGDQVKRGATLVEIEAMKTRYEIKAESNMVIKELSSKVGETLERGEHLLTFNRS